MMCGLKGMSLLLTHRSKPIAQKLPAAHLVSEAILTLNGKGHSAQPLKTS